MPVCLYSIIERNAQRGCMHSARYSSERRCDRAPGVRTRGATCRLSRLHRASLPTFQSPCLVLFRLTWARAGSSSVISCATAGQVATPFTSNPVWWAGLISMISGEVIPFSITKRSSLDCPSYHRSSAGRNAFCDVSFAIYSYALCLCQAFNLLAYGYSPTSLVAPVGAIGVLVNGEPHEAGSV